MLFPFVFPFIVLFFAGFRIAQEYQRGVVFRLGRFSSVKGPGLYWIIPLIDRQKQIDIRTTTVAVEQQETITKDSVTIKVNAVLWYRIVEPAKAIISVANFGDAVYQVALTSLRNIIGQHVLDEVLKERDAINLALAKIVNEATAAWGIQVEMVEMKDVEIPANAPTGNYKQVVASQKIFPVTAGSNTFRLLADEGTGAVVVDERTLSVVFIPTSYGTVE